MTDNNTQLEKETTGMNQNTTGTSPVENSQAETPVSTENADSENIEQAEEINGFDKFGLRPEVLKSIKKLGFEMPSPIQEKSIKPLLDGFDVLGQAQTGTGKTAAFALPLLSRISVETRDTQVLIIAPTRELALQVAEACQSFAKYLQKFSVLPIYGGASYDVQLKALKRGAQLVVGTPGRVMDLIKRGALVLDKLKALVLDEADEMLLRSRLTSELLKKLSADPDELIDGLNHMHRYTDSSGLICYRTGYGLSDPPCCIG